MDKDSDALDALKQVWRDVGDEFAELGRTMRDSFRAAGETADPTAGADPTDPAADPAAWAAPDASERVGGDDGHSVTDELRRAFDQFISASKEFAERVGAVTRDADVQGRTKQVAGRFGDAMEKTFSQIGEDLRTTFSRKGDNVDDDTIDATTAENVADAAPGDRFPADGPTTIADDPEPPATA